MNQTDPQDYSSFSSAYSSVAARLGLGDSPFDEKIFKEFRGRCEHWSIEAYWIFRKLELTLNRLDGAGSAKHPEEAERALGEIKRLLEAHLLAAPEREKYVKFHSRASLLLCAVSGLGEWEAFLRNAAFGKNMIYPIPAAGREDKLRISSMTVTEKCKLGCDYCSIDAKSTGREMDLTLFTDLFASDQIRSSNLYLGDGEILTHSDRRLAGVIRRLITEYGISVGFTTAGLLAGNAQTGRDFLKGLKDLGPYSEDLRITVSFNLINPVAKRDRGAYIERMKETFSLIGGIMRRGRNIRVHSMHGGHCREASAHETTEALRWAANGYEVAGGDLRQVAAVGRGLHTYSRSEEPEKSRELICGNMAIDADMQSFRICPEGDVTIHCLNPGPRGSRFGNIYENDMGQIRAAYDAFVKKFGEERMKEGPKAYVCEAHRTCGITIRPPQSDNPIAKWSMRPCEPRRLHARR